MTSYRRVPQRDNSNNNNNELTDHGASLGSSVTRSRAERFSDKLTAIAWVTLAVLVARYTEFFHVFVSNEANNTMMRLAFIGFGIITVLFMYLTMYLPKIKGLQVDSTVWSVYCPKVIPAMTFISLCTYLFALRGMWPVYGFLSPLIFGTQLMGLLMALHFIPAGRSL